MTTYLTIITTVLVLTQIIRITQNTINLKMQNKQIERDIAWVKNTDVGKKDFEMQREAFRLIVEHLKEKSVDEFIEGEY